MDYSRFEEVMVVVIDEASSQESDLQRKTKMSVEFLPYH